MAEVFAFSASSQRSMHALQKGVVQYVIFAVLLCVFFAQAHAKNVHQSQSATQACGAGVNVSTSLQQRFALTAPNDVVSQHISWLCYYGSDRSVLSLTEYDLFILEADAIGSLSPEEKAGRVCLAYMSLGELVQSRWFWTNVQDKPWLLENNPDWPGAHRIDPRSPEWADLLIHNVAPALLAAGYDGFLLDNVDIGEYLENKDPALYEGASLAVAEMIRRLRKSYPDAVLIANGGLSTAAEVADCLNAVMIESTVSTWLSNEDGTFSYGEISPQSKAWLRPRLLRIRGAGLPILALEYVDPSNMEEQQRVRETAKKAGHHPYIAERSLMHFPGSNRLSSQE